MQERHDEVARLLREIKDAALAGCTDHHAEKARATALNGFYGMDLDAESIEMCQMVEQHLEVRWLATCF